MVVHVLYIRDIGQNPCLKDNTALVERASVLLAAIYENKASHTLDLSNGAPGLGFGEGQGGPRILSKSLGCPVACLFSVDLCYVQGMYTLLLIFD